MRSGIRIGRIFGVKIYLDLSWFFIFLLVTWNLAAGVFPAMHPDWSPALTWGVAIAASLLFFASVLAHELSHALMAMARGIPVARITLFIFGGVANIEREPDSPASEFLIAIVGPITSVVLGIAFLALGGFLANAGGLAAGNIQQVMAGLGPVATLLFWLGPINILLGIFNMLPGFPLDGGRVLRSILWAITNNLRTATQWASLAGQALAWAFIIGGVAMIFGVSIPVFGTGFIGGLWLVFIGWFLNTAAIQSYRQVVIDDMLEGVPVSRLMRAESPTIAPHLPISELVDSYIMKTDEHAFPVVEGDQLVGLVCLEDVRRVSRDAWDVTPVSQIMTPASSLDLATPREDANDAFNRLARRDVNQVPVVQDGRLVGMLRRRDITRWLHTQSEFAR